MRKHTPFRLLIQVAKSHLNMKASGTRDSPTHRSTETYLIIDETTTEPDLLCRNMWRTGTRKDFSVNVPGHWLIKVIIAKSNWRPSFVHLNYGFSPSITHWTCQSFRERSRCFKMPTVLSLLLRKTCKISKKNTWSHHLYKGMPS